ncbi:chemotaxis protein CheB [Dyella japonica]|uniref:protein-glutamate methylesterase n=1 Tax=Dyella japonica DSM 16301 TaxID=1440762 RepID=A0A0G9H8B5_9GAMM|nr:chemotaxis protein CheB [Dyella japonica]KLD65494.1 hypothetical protein Y882_03015 [Dyella japonica DSM 16301]
MAETATAVALLFDDVELGGQLREALRERGARIVHEGALSTLDKQMIVNTGAEVLVVNLDEDADDDLDRLYDVIDGDRPRVVFNDAAASRSLNGWDRARWARHLAVKVMAQGDLDPPRPQDAPAVPEVAEPVAVESVEVPAVVVPDEPLPSFAAALEPVALAEITPAEITPQAVEATEVQSESLAAELEAFISADEPALAEAEAGSELSFHASEEPLHLDDFAALKDVPFEAEDEFGSGLKFSADEPLPELHDGNFGAPEGHAAVDHDFGSGLKFSADAELPPLHDGSFGLDTLTTQGHAPIDAPAPDAAARHMPSFQLDHLALAPLDESFMPSTAVAESQDKSPSALLGAASAWALLDEGEAPAPSTPAPAKATNFGVEKLSAADFLAPEGGEETASIIEPGMTLELVSMEEALAPKEFDATVTEMMLDDLDSAISRLLVLGAAADSLEAVCSFLSMLPADLRAAVLHVQHLGGKSVEALSDTLTRYSELPVRIAAQGMRARIGEVLVVPDGHQARVHRDGRVELQSLDNSDVRSSPIDASFTLAANVFGRNAQAIVFAGQANDALGGCQAIHDRGGQVWIESSDGQFADMVHGIEAERLHSYSGTPAELAARLVEEMSMEGRR